MIKRKIVVVTGANRGIGLAVCEDILLNYSPVKLYACSRAGKNLGLKPSNSSSAIEYAKLDITQSPDIDALASKIKSADGQVDVLINNAGLNKENVTSLKDAEEITNVNYYGTLNMCQAFMPLMAKQSRIVNVSSTASNTRAYANDLQAKLHDPNLSVGDINHALQSYLKAFGSGKLNDWGNRPPYSASKSCLNALTAVLARDNPDVYVNCCCPGWVNTELGRVVGEPPKTPAEGARIPVRVGFGNIGDVTGQYWANPGVFDTGEGQIIPW